MIFAIRRDSLEFPVRQGDYGESCLRLIRALAVETHEDWLEANRYLDMKQLAEHKREPMKEAA